MNNYFELRKDRFGCIRLEPQHYTYLTCYELASKLTGSIRRWQQGGIRGVWIKVDLDHSNFIPTFVENGFDFHHAQPGYLMMSKWISETEPDNLPSYASQYLAEGQGDEMRRGGSGSSPQGQARPRFDPYSRDRFQQASTPSGNGAGYDSYEMGGHGGGHGGGQGGGHSGGARGYGDHSAGQSGDNFEQGCVLMVYRLHKDKMNATKLFNLFCLYGNVVRIKFLKSGTEESAGRTAMVQMEDGISCERALQNLHDAYIFAYNIRISYSKQDFVQPVPKPYAMPDGSPSYMEFTGNRGNRFTNPDAAAKNRIEAPAKCLYYWNAPVKMSEDYLNAIFRDAGVKAPSNIRQFPSKAKSSTGLLEWGSAEDATEALAVGNHTEIPNPTGKYPFIFKMCFSSQEFMQ